MRYADINAEGSSLFSGINHWYDSNVTKAQDSSKWQAADSLVIVFGHTHTLQQYPAAKDEDTTTQKASKAPRFRALNVPSWLKDRTEGKAHSQEMRAVCLYLDKEKEGELFIGWDWLGKKPFHVPPELVQDLKKFESTGDDEAKNRLKNAIPKLRKIKWPEGLVTEWEDKIK